MLLLGFAGGFVISYVRSSRCRRAALVLWALLPAVLFFLEGVAAGCLFGGGEECMWFGWGLVFLPFLSLLWLAAVVGGTVLNRLKRTA